MIRYRLLAVWGSLLPLALPAASLQAADGPLRCLQEPLVWIVGQQTRVVIQTPPDCGPSAPAPLPGRARGPLPALHQSIERLHAPGHGGRAGWRLLPAHPGARSPHRRRAGDGDRRQLSYAISLHRTGVDEWTLQSPVEATLRLPGAPPLTIIPGQDGAAGGMAWKATGAASARITRRPECRP